MVMIGYTQGIELYVFRIGFVAWDRDIVRENREGVGLRTQVRNRLWVG